MWPAEQAGASEMRMPKRPNIQRRVLALRILIAYEVIALTYVTVVIVTEGLESAARPIMLALIGAIAFAFSWRSSTPD